MSDLWLGHKYGFCENKKNQCSAARELVWQHNRWEKKVRKREKKPRAEKDDTGRFKLSLKRGINSAHEFPCTCNIICVHITCKVVTVHAIYEGLSLLSSKKVMLYIFKTTEWDDIVLCKTFKWENVQTSCKNILKKVFERFINTFNWWYENKEEKNESVLLV